MAAAMTAPGLAPRLGLRVDGPAGLAVLDFAAPADRPATVMETADGTWLAADARLDEDVELGAAWARFGPDLPDRLAGDFALAAWSPAERRLVCTRDVVGTRPLCWHHRPGRLLAFASLPKGLIGGGVVAAVLDRVALGRLLAEPFDCGETTNFKEVRRLRAGHSLIVTADGGIRLHRAWTPEPRQVGRRRITPADAAAELRALVEQAVRCRLPPAGPVATQLSGGLDSSAIAVIAARTLRPQGRLLHAFSLLARPWDGVDSRDERPHVEAVLRQEPDIRWQEFHPSPADDDDPGDPDLPPHPLALGVTDRMCAAAAALGSPLLLSGAGGDEGATYNGLAIHAALLRQGRWAALGPALRALAARTGEPVARVALNRLVRPLLPDWLVAVRNRITGRLPPLRYQQREALDFLTPALRRQVAETLSPDPMWRNRPRDRVEMLADSYVIGRADRWSILAARHGVGFSYPLLDRRIIDFALSLPLECFVAGGWSRQPYRDAMAGILPDTVRLRTDKGVTTPGAMLDFAQARPGLLAQVERLRGGPAAEWIDLPALAAAITAAPDWDEARTLAAGAAPPPLRWKRAVNALMALSLARQMHRWDG
jgi:asparagine synthase (glutamine-hydrolysing)